MSDTRYPIPDTRLCVITRAVPRLHRDHLAVAQGALEGGARFLQFREKEMSTRELVETAAALLGLTRAFGAVLVVNDRVDVALSVGADGVHVGESDLPVAEARRILGSGAIIGASAATVESAQRAAAEGANYLGVGPIYQTGSKADAGEAIGLGPLAAIRAAVSLPLLAIGGINAENAAQVIQAGAHGVAVISAVSDAEDIARATAELLQKITAQEK
jgi:thiamine-phosphate pyrophosphorylase